MVSGSILDASVRTVPLLKRQTTFVSLLSTRTGHQRACYKVSIVIELNVFHPEVLSKVILG